MRDRNLIVAQSPNAEVNDDRDVWLDAGAAREEIRTILAQVAKERSVITYGELCARLKSAVLDPHGSTLAHLLGEISEMESDEGRGMLSVVVVRQDDTMPGDGFFQLAHQLGRDTSDRERCWIDEAKLVYSAWA